MRSAYRLSWRAVADQAPYAWSNQEDHSWLSRVKRASMVATLLVGLVVLSGCEYSYTGAGFPIIEENPNAEPWFNVYRPADMVNAVETKGHLLPVIVWANGGCFRADFPWQPLFKRWAAEGYVVLALSEAPAAEGGALGVTTVADHGAMIDWALTQSPYVDMLDSTRVVAAGNSCGGVTALGLAARDPRVTAVFVLSGSSAIGSSSKTIMQAITAPVGYVVGGSIDVAAGPALQDYNNLPDDAPAMVVRRARVDHLTLSTNVAMLEKSADIAYRWMDLVLYGSESSYAVLTSETVCPTCKPGDWSLTAKNLDTLIQ